MTRKVIALLFLFPPVLLLAQDDKTPKFGITFSGYVKTDFMVDSRQTFAPREGHFLLWPMPVVLDIEGEDIHDGYNTNFLPVQSQLSGKITGPDVFRAKTSGVIEADFFGTTNADINLLRLRHAFMKLNWTRSELLMGQFWHPLFNTSCFPATVSFNTGAPINPFSRDPQIRFSYSLGKFKVMGAAVEQRDYPSYGPEGGTSTYLRNAGIPELYAEISYSAKSGDNLRAFTGGVIAGTKSIVPRLESKMKDKTYKVNESVNSKSAGAYFNLKLKPVTIKCMGIYGENLSDVLSINGFAVIDVSDTITGKRSYAPVANMVCWTDIHTNGQKWQAGIFAGFNKNLGTHVKMEDPAAPIYGLPNWYKQELTMVYRIAPRLIYNAGKTRFAAEVEHTTATFGAIDSQGKITRNGHGLPLKTNTVSNTRFLIGVYYFF